MWNFEATQSVSGVRSRSLLPKRFLALCLRRSVGQLDCTSELPGWIHKLSHPLMLRDVPIICYVQFCAYTERDFVVQDYRERRSTHVGTRNCGVVQASFG